MVTLERQPRSKTGGTVALAAGSSGACPPDLTAPFIQFHVARLKSVRTHMPFTLLDARVLRKLRTLWGLRCRPLERRDCV